MKRYETIAIIDPDLSEDGRKPVLERINGLIPAKGGQAILVDEWGARRLAYEIKKRSRGYYIRFDYCGDGDLVDEIERFCRIDDRVLKYMTVLTDDKADPEEIQREIDEEQKRVEAAAATAAEQAAAEQAAAAAPDPAVVEKMEDGEPAAEQDPSSEAPSDTETAPEAPETAAAIEPDDDDGEHVKEAPNEQ